MIRKYAQSKRSEHVAILCNCNMFRGHAYANFERGQVLPEIGGLCPRQDQRHAVELERMDHHQIVGVAEIFNGQTASIDQPAVASLGLREPANSVGIEGGIVGVAEAEFSAPGHVAEL